MSKKGLFDKLAAGYLRAMTIPMSYWERSITQNIRDLFEFC